MEKATRHVWSSASCYGQTPKVQPTSVPEAEPASVAETDPSALDNGSYMARPAAEGTEARSGVLASNESIGEETVSALVKRIINLLQLSWVCEALGSELLVDLPCTKPIIYSE